MAAKRTNARDKSEKRTEATLRDAHSGLRMIESFIAPHPSQDARMAMGKARRKAVPRSRHAELSPRSRKFDPIAMIEAENATRIPALVPIRVGRMAASPFAFLRGAADIMAADLAPTPVTGIEVMACGDVHLANFGLFASAERHLVFAINDFDQVHPAPWEWDLKRLATSAAVAAIFLGGDRNQAAEAAHAIVRAYQRRMRHFAGMSFLEIWYDLIDEQEVLDCTPERLKKSAQEVIDKARARGHLHALGRLTEEVDGQRRIIEDPPLIVRETLWSDGTPVIEALDTMLQSYRRSLPEDRRLLLSRYRVVDVVRKVVGVGSVGLSCWVILLEGHDADDPLFLQVKEARRSVLAPYVTTKLHVDDPGQRVVMGQRMIQGSPDIFLGWGPDHGGDRDRGFYVRQLADMKGGVRYAPGERDTLEGLPEHCGLCGWALALAHAKSGDPAMISGYCGESDALPDAICEFALAYLDRTLADHRALEAAIRTGRITAVIA